MQSRVFTTPIEWDIYATPEHWNPDIFDIYLLEYTANSIEEVWQQVKHLPWVETPEILSIVPIIEPDSNELEKQL